MHSIHDYRNIQTVNKRKLIAKSNSSFIFTIKSFLMVQHDLPKLHNLFYIDNQLFNSKKRLFKLIKI